MLQKAHQLKPQHLEYAVAFAQAQFFANQNKLSQQSKMLLVSVLQKMPNNIAALNLLAINAYSQQRYKKAIYYWEKMLPLFQPGSKDSQVLLAMIAKAQKHL